MAVKTVFGNVFNYLSGDRGAGHLANFSIVTGSQVIGGQKFWLERQRMVHRMLLVSLAPNLPEEADPIILPDNDSDQSLIILKSILTFLYSGR